MKILILGITGMLGHTLWGHLCTDSNWEVYGTCRKTDLLPQNLPEVFHLERVTPEVDAEDFVALRQVIEHLRPDWVINCIGLIKQQQLAQEAVAAISLNALLPHLLAEVCKENGARLLHISTDCVFSGASGGYSEKDTADAEDLYGRTKLLGEVDYPHCLTLRTSIIGHELQGKHGLLEWFLAQKGTVKGYKRAIFSGLPTIELSRIIGDYVLPSNDLQGIYHVSANAISKYDLLNLVAQRYITQTAIQPDEEFIIDRSLVSSRFLKVTGYIPPHWPELVEEMYQHFLKAPFYMNRRSK